LGALLYILASGMSQHFWFADGRLPQIEKERLGAFLYTLAGSILFAKR
jgi:hypothetical protein